MPRRFNAYGSLRVKKPAGLSADLALAPTHKVRAGPDADLVAACGAFLAVQARIDALFTGPDRIEDDRQRTAAVEALEAERWPLVQQMAEHRAVTFDGIVARLHVLRLVPAELEQEAEDEGDDGRLLRLMLRDITAIYGQRP